MQRNQFRDVTLTPREWDVCQMLRQGRPQREIAERLIVERRTVYWYTAELRGKFGVRSTNALLRVLMDEEKWPSAAKEKPFVCVPPIAAVPHTAKRFVARF